MAEPGGGAAATTGAFRTLAVVAADGSVVGRTSRAGVDGDGGAFARAAVVGRGAGGRSVCIATSGFRAELGARATAGFVWVGAVATGSDSGDGGASSGMIGAATCLASEGAAMADGRAGGGGAGGAGGAGAGTEGATAIAAAGAIAGSGAGGGGGATTGGGTGTGGAATGAGAAAAAGGGGAETTFATGGGGGAGAVGA